MGETVSNKFANMFSTIRLENMATMFNAIRLHSNTLIYDKFAMEAIANSYYKIVE